MACERDRKFLATLDKCTKRIEKGDEYMSKQWLRIEAREGVVRPAGKLAWSRSL